MRWSFWRRKRHDADLEDEIAHDLALDADERMRSGMSREEAERSSRRDFGNVLLVKEGIRDMWGWTSLERFAQDLRYGWRTLRKNRSFAAMAALSLALGIGANTAIYSFMDAILMRSLPVPHPEQLVIFNWHSKAFPAIAHSFSGSWDNDPHTGCTGNSYPYPAFEFLRGDSRVLSSLFAFTDARLNLIVQGQAEIGSVQFVTGGFFGALEVPPAEGRWIGEEDDRFGAAPVVVIGYRYWRSRFALSPGAVGQSMLINGTLFTIVGASGPGFFGVNPAGAPDLFIPLHASTSLEAQARDAQRFSNKNAYWVQMMGRLRPGIGVRQAQAALAAQFHQFAADSAATPQEKADLPALLLEDGAGGLDSLRRQYSRPLYVLMSLVGLILAIACANIASLLLARAAARRREMAVRISLGAGRLRVVRQLLTEHLLLASIGGLLALPVAALGIRFITWLLANGRASFTLHANLNWHVLAFTFALALITGSLFGLVPAIHATNVDLTPALKEARTTAAQQRLRHSLIRVSPGQLLVVSQIAISLLLVIAAGLFVRTLSNLNSIELGFNREHVLLFSLNARQAGYKDMALARFYADLRSRFRSIPGVRDVTLSDYALVSNSGSLNGVTIPGVARPAGREPGTSFLNVGPSFFTAMQIPVLLGREIEERDAAGPHRVAVVNEIFAKKYFGSESPIGRRFGLEDDKADIEIVGVAKAARYNSLKRKVPPVVYIPYSQDLRTLGQMTFELRANGDPLALVNTIRQIVHQAEPRLPVSNVNTQSRQIDQTINQERAFAELCTCFAMLALLISCVGVYGTMAYAVARRTSEIGIRMALGAERLSIVWMVLREVLLLGSTGLAIGLAVAWGTTRYVESFLFGMKRNDPLAISLSIGILIAALILAGYAPASRASRIDPMTALRNE